MNKILIVVDMQNDFLDGSLANPKACEKIDLICDYIESFNGKVICTMDTHGEDYLNTQEGKNLPIKHCIKYTPGWLVNDKIKNKISYAKGKFIAVEKENFGYIRWYSVLDKYIVGQETDTEITLVGTVTSICVISNALILKALYPEAKIKVISDLCADLTPEKHEAALEVMRSCQIEVE